VVAPDEAPGPRSNFDHAARRVAAKHDSAPLRDLRSQQRGLKDALRRSAADLSAAALREERIRAAALLALHEGLPELPGRALLDLVRRRTELDLKEAFGLVSDVFDD
jgi:hypothetical protein